MKSVLQTHPRLYLSISHSSHNKYDVEYYENQYDYNGNLKINSKSILNDTLDVNKSNKINLYKINKSEYKTLISVIDRQKKVIEIYSKKDKTDQFKIVSASLQLMLDYQKVFLKWFSENEVSSNE